MPSVNADHQVAFSISRLRQLIKGLKNDDHFAKYIVDAEDFIELMDQSFLSEDVLLLQVLVLYRNNKYEELLAFIAKNKFPKKMHAKLRRYLHQCHRNLLAQRGIFPLRDDLVDVPANIRDPRGKNVRAKRRLTMNVVASSSDSNAASRLALKLHDDATFKDHLVEAEDYITAMDPSADATEQEFILQILVAYRRDDPDRMKALIESGKFSPSMKDQLRFFLRMCLKKAGEKNGNIVRPYDITRYPKEIASSVRTNPEVQLKLEAGWAKRSENLKAKFNYQELEDATGLIRKKIYRYFAHRKDQEEGMSKEQVKKHRAEKKETILNGSINRENKDASIQRRNRNIQLKKLRKEPSIKPAKVPKVPRAGIRKSARLQRSRSEEEDVQPNEEHVEDFNESMDVDEEQREEDGLMEEDIEREFSEDAETSPIIIDDNLVDLAMEEETEREPISKQRKVPKVARSGIRRSVRLQQSRRGEEDSESDEEHIEDFNESMDVGEEQREEDGLMEEEIEREMSSETCQLKRAASNEPSSSNPTGPSTSTADQNINTGWLSSSEQNDPAILIARLLDDECYRNYLHYANNYLNPLHHSIMNYEEVILAALVAFREDDFLKLLKLLLSIVVCPPQYAETMRVVFQIAYQEYAEEQNMDIISPVPLPSSIAETSTGHMIPVDSIAERLMLNQEEVQQWLNANDEAEMNSIEERWERRRQRTQHQLVRPARAIPEQNSDQPAEEEVEPKRRRGKRTRCSTRGMKKSSEQQAAGPSEKRRRQHQQRDEEDQLEPANSFTPSSNGGFSTPSHEDRDDCHEDAQMEEAQGNVQSTGASPAMEASATNEDQNESDGNSVIDELIQALEGVPRSEEATEFDNALYMPNEVLSDFQILEYSEELNEAQQLDNGVPVIGSAEENHEAPEEQVKANEEGSGMYHDAPLMEIPPEEHFEVNDGRDDANIEDGENEGQHGEVYDNRDGHFYDENAGYYEQDEEEMEHHVQDAINDEFYWNFFGDQWPLPLEWSIHYRTWNVAQMAEWVYLVTGSEESRQIILAEEMDGHSMEEIQADNVQVGLGFDIEAYELLVDAAWIMIDRAGYP